MRICCDCNKNAPIGDDMFFGGGTHPICAQCYERLQREVGEAVYADSNRAMSILSGYANNGMHSPVVANSLMELYFQAVNNSYLHIVVSVVNNGRLIGLNDNAGNVVMYQDPKGYIMLSSCPNERFIPQEYSWEGSQYKTVTVSQTSGGTTTRSKSKTRRKGGLLGAAAGTAIGAATGGIFLAPVGAGIGYSATSKGVTKGKSRTVNNTRVTTHANDIEVDNMATVVLRNANTNNLVAIGVKCNSAININFKMFRWLKTN